jgi:hypothetical protein
VSGIAPQQHIRHEQQQLKNWKTEKLKLATESVELGCLDSVSTPTHAHRHYQSVQSGKKLAKRGFAHFNMYVCSNTQLQGGVFQFWKREEK